ncbi:hypothetical protein GRI97_05020 [Altererythrobacter xixiisoli]|uniref:Uncharacterized protein n=1 Tax=Croceibacterium xixiisoli TaxID=1476466 RepID=A0A6I4TQB8_9SPHN|nr:hypothetical protein [Croceibacterium xixiisoli]MXO98345.1 hypothetical protein [Croceibacterium xixiisoli]
MNVVGPRQWPQLCIVKDADKRDQPLHAMLGQDAPARVRSFIKLFRGWASARRRGENPLPAMFALDTTATDTPEWVPACDSYFSLTEACIGRPLVHASNDTSLLAPDEIALLATLRQSATTGTIATDHMIPHGLPGALLWAARSVLRTLTDDIRFLMALDLERQGRCPFQPPRIGPSMDADYRLAM